MREIYHLSEGSFSSYFSLENLKRVVNVPLVVSEILSSIDSLGI